MFYYERVPDVETRIRNGELPPEEGMLQSLWMIYENPDIEVFGPSNVLEQMSA